MHYLEIKQNSGQTYNTFMLHCQGDTIETRSLIKECVHSTMSECLKWNHHTIISLLTVCACGIISFRELLMSRRNTDRFLVKLFVCAKEKYVGKVVRSTQLL